MLRGLSYRLRPTPDQADKLTLFASVCRVVYNAALEQRDTQWHKVLEQTGHRISFASQCRELTTARDEIDWIAEVPRVMQEHALLDLDIAFSRFFKGTSRYPIYRRKGVNESIRYKGREAHVERLNAKWSSVLVPKLGMVKFRDTRPHRGEVKTVTIDYAAGRWSITFACEFADVPSESAPGVVGIDRGVANTLALSMGELLSLPKTLDAVEQRKRRAQRVLARRHRGSARYSKQRRRVASLHARMGRIRRDWQHKVTTDIACRFGVVVIEDLQITNMLAKGRNKRGLNRSISNQSWGAIARLLAYKIEERSGTLVKVNPAYTSQTCSACGAIDSRSRESQAVFKCVHCGHRAHADTNAALNILRRGSTSLLRAEGSGCGPDETRTVNHGALAA